MAAELELAAPSFGGVSEGRGIAEPAPLTVLEAATGVNVSGHALETFDEGFGSRLFEVLVGETKAVRARAWVVSRTLAFADVTSLLTAFLLAQIAAGAPAGGALDARTEYLFFVLTVPAWIYVAKLYGLYVRDAERADHSTLDDIVPVLHLVTLGSWFFFGATWLTGIAEPNFVQLGSFWTSALVLLLISRAVARTMFRRSDLYRQNALIVGAGVVGQLVARKFIQHPEYGIDPVGFVDDQPTERSDEMADLTLLGDPEELPSIAERHNIDRVIFAFSNDSHTRTLELVRALRDLPVQIDIVPRLFEVLGPGATLHAVGGVPLVGMRPLSLSRTSRFLKRAVDLAISLTGLLLLAPSFALIALAVKLTSKGPIIFRQTRMGAGNQTFKMWKFRTMSVDADNRKSEFAHLNKHNGGDPRMFKIPDDPRVTSVGRFLRKYSLDEVPQLVNVIRGQMTLVGPRPLILEEDQHVEAWGRQRLTLKPGITGPWQVLGRTDIEFEEMVKLDYLYVTNWSLWRDLKLMAQTVPAIFRSRSIVY